MYYTKAEIQEKDGKIVGIASTSVQDRQGEVVDVEGWDLKNFKKAPRLLWAHDHTEPAIGKVSKIWFEGSGKTKSMKFEAVFQDVTEKARAIAQLVKDGFINTFSVGFKPLEIDGMTITKSELLEISVVNVPANPEAMLLAVKSLKQKGFDQEVIEEIVDEDTKSLEHEAEIKALKTQVAQMNEQLESAVKGLRNLAPHRSKRVAEQRLTMAKAIAKAADKLVVQPQTATTAKIIKRSSEMLIRDFKGDLNGSTERFTQKSTRRNNHR